MKFIPRIRGKCNNPSLPKKHYAIGLFFINIFILGSRYFYIVTSTIIIDQYS